MTEQLKTLMDRAADQDFAAVDLDAITAAGDRTVRRRRVATGVAGVAVLAVIATGAALLGGDDGDEKADFVDDPFRDGRADVDRGQHPAHAGPRPTTSGLDVYSFVRTSEGIVFIGSGRSRRHVRRLLVRRRGEPTQIGETEDPHLRADPDEPYVGWLDRTRRRPRRSSRPGSRRTGRGASRQDRRARSRSSRSTATRRTWPTSTSTRSRVVDLGPGRQATGPGQRRWLGFVDVEGELVVPPREPGRRGLGLEVRRSDGRRGRDPRTTTADGAVFSPDGRWISAARERGAGLRHGDRRARSTVGRHRRPGSGTSGWTATP